MPMRLGTRAFFKSLLLMAGLPSLLAAQGPAALPNYQPSGYIAQPQFVSGVPNVVAPQAPSTQFAMPQGRNVAPIAAGSQVTMGGANAVPQVQTGPYAAQQSSTQQTSAQPFGNSTVTGAAQSPALNVGQQPSSSMPVYLPAAAQEFQSPANAATSGISAGTAAQPIGFAGNIMGRRSDSLTPTSGTEAFGKLKPFPSLSSMPMLNRGSERSESQNGESLRINAPAQFASFQEPEYSVGEPIASTTEGCADMPWCSGPSNSGYFASLEALLFFVNKPNVATFGDEASERLVSVNSVVFSFENSLDTSWMSNDGGWGQRFEFGNIKCDSGWFASFWNIKQVQSYNVTGVNFAPSDPFLLMSGFFDGNGDGIDDDLNNNQIYGRSGQDLGTFDAGPPPGFIAPFDGTPDVGAPTDTNDMIVYLQTFSQVASSNKLTMQNFELNRLLRLPGHNWNNEFDYYYGVRYLKVRDQYNVTATGGFLDQSFWHAESDNNLIGPQIGARWSRRARAIGFSVDGRFLAAYNQQDNDLRGQYANNLTNVGVANAPAALTRLSFIDGFGNDEFSAAGELRADMVLKMSRSWAFKVGYTGLIIDNISRSSPKIVYALPASSLQDVDSNTTLLSHGINFGLEYNR
jgi:hypothetical protein